jgi:hypothetical protein
MLRPTSCDSTCSGPTNRKGVVIVETIDVDRSGSRAHRRISRISLAVVFAVMMAAGVLGPGTSASAARPAGERVIGAQEEEQLFQAGCREVDDFRVNVWSEQTGGTVLDEWEVGVRFQYFRQSTSSPFRWESWLPRGVPPDHPNAFRVWVQNGGHSPC